MYGLPPLVLECPECGERYLISNPQNKPSGKAIVYSDGFFFDELNRRTPFVIGCVTCELGFFPESGKLIAEPTWDQVFSIWGNVKWAQPPTPSQLALELRVRKHLPVEQEIALRKEFWYAGNHSTNGVKLLKQNSKFNDFWYESIFRLENLGVQIDP
jgi:hypothetical protein